MEPWTTAVVATGVLLTSAAVAFAAAALLAGTAVGVCGGLYAMKRGSP